MYSKILNLIRCSYFFIIYVETGTINFAFLVVIIIVCVFVWFRIELLWLQLSDICWTWSKNSTFSASSNTEPSSTATVSSWYFTTAAFLADDQRLPVFNMNNTGGNTVPLGMKLFIFQKLISFGNKTKMNKLCGQVLLHLILYVRLYSMGLSIVVWKHNNALKLS